VQKAGLLFCREGGIIEHPILANRVDEGIINLFPFYRCHVVTYIAFIKIKPDSGVQDVL